MYDIFQDKASCFKFLEKSLWPTGPACPYCKSINISVQHRENRYHCNQCNTGFSITVGTIFQKTKVDLRIWFYLIYLYDRNLIQSSLRVLGEEIGVTKDTVAKMLRAIKRAKAETPELLNLINNHIKNNV